MFLPLWIVYRLHVLVADAAVSSVEPRFILPKPGTSHAYDRYGATGMQYHLAIVQMQRAQARAGRPIEPTRCFGTAANGTHKTTPIHQPCPFGLTSISVGQGIGRCSAEEHAVFFSPCAWGVWRSCGIPGEEKRKKRRPTLSNVAWAYFPSVPGADI